MEGPLLVGTVHLAREDAPRLLRILDDAAPVLVTVEISRFSVEFRRRRERAWLSQAARALRAVPPGSRGHGRIRLLIRQIRMPWEWKAALSWAESRGARVIPVDTGALSRTELPRWEKELLTRENLRALSRLPDLDLKAHLEEERARARLAVSGRVRPARALLSDPFWTRRERLLSRRLIRLRGCWNRMVHIGGWMHLVPEAPTLRHGLECAGARPEVRLAL